MGLFAIYSRYLSRLRLTWSAATGEAGFSAVSGYRNAFVVTSGEANVVRPPKWTSVGQALA